MGKFIVGVVMNVLTIVVINRGECSGIERVAASTGNFVILDAGKFVVLHPKICFQNFRGGGEPKQCGISTSDVLMSLLCEGRR